MQDPHLEYPQEVQGEDHLLQEEDFIESLRLAFIKKVLGIVFIQITFTFGVILLASTNATFGSMMRNWITFTLGIILFLGSIITLFVGNLGKKVPVNYILLSLFTIGESMIVSGSTQDMPTRDIVVAMLVFAVTTMALAGASCLI
mmetsp:Transcript_1145/g.1150  ORF Transcript_1145/g.1150 Transcript_1145/m.1150 type:complete len:145 (-) Transcript_1145:321-755(-)